MIQNVVVEGTVTTGAGVFFDAFYLQDDTTVLWHSMKFQMDL